MSLISNLDAAQDQILKKNRKQIRGKIWRATLKSFTFSFLFVTLLFLINWPHFWTDAGYIIMYASCFIFCYRIVFNFWFGRKILKYVETYPLQSNDTTIDAINVSNGYPSGLGYLAPISHHRD